MGIASWFKKWRRGSDTEAVERYEQWTTETPEERRISEEGVVGVQADEFVARGVHEGNIEDAERFAEDT